MLCGKCLDGSLHKSCGNTREGATVTDFELQVKAWALSLFPRSVGEEASLEELGVLWAN